MRSPGTVAPTAPAAGRWRPGSRTATTSRPTTTARATDDPAPRRRNRTGNAGGPHPRGPPRPQALAGQGRPLARHPRSGYSDIERGRRGVEARELKRLAALLGTTPDELLATEAPDEPCPADALGQLHPADRRSAELYAGYLRWRRTAGP
ncbi:helix-turn-helix domain-containing protein [Kitasatospora sp. NPDC048296]|uniref:helix-turn-helix domain-containing protein n=1 Tax=Kitasatospora sp. NPDC048296 TaxID=3364048 RepID=UPI003718F49D